MGILRDFILLMAAFNSVYSEVIIPDKMYTKKRKLTYYEITSSWYAADGQCRKNGGYLVELDSNRTRDAIQRFSDTLPLGVGDFFTRMAFDDDGNIYLRDDTCQPISESNVGVAAKSVTDFNHDTRKQCTESDVSHFYAWRRTKCTDYRHALCESQGGECEFKTTSVSLMSLPVPSVTMGACQATCREILGCFATAPSSTPYGQCLFIITGDNSNPMAALTCTEFVYDDTTDPTNTPHENTGENPIDCHQYQEDYVPATTTTESPNVQQPAHDFFQQYNSSSDPCIQDASISPSPVVETTTVYATLVVTTTAPPVVQTVSPPPDIETTTLYATVVQTVTPSPDVETTTVYATHVITTTTPPVIQTVNPPPDIETTTVYATVVQTATATVTASATSTTTTTASVVDRPAPKCVTVNDTRSEEEALGELDVVVKNLKLSRTTLSKYRRQKESASDERISARTLGASAAFILVMLAILLLGIDANNMWVAMQRLKKTCSEFRSQKGVIFVENIPTNPPHART